MQPRKFRCIKWRLSGLERTYGGLAHEVRMSKNVIHTRVRTRTRAPRRKSAKPSLSLFTPNRTNALCIVHPSYPFEPFWSSSLSTHASLFKAESGAGVFITGRYRRSAVGQFICRKLLGLRRVAPLLRKAIRKNCVKCTG